jgi:hypothetical protein
MSRILAILSLVCIIQVTFAQNIPCKSYPMAGYRGNCSVTSALSSDRKYIYTTDRITLKKWDIATNKVVAEIPGFMWNLAGGTDNPRFLRVTRESGIFTHPQDDLYDLKQKAMVADPKVTLLRLMPEGKRKSFEKTLYASAFTVYFSSDSTYAGLVDTSGKLYQLQISTGKMNLLIAGNNVMHFIQEINTFTVYGLKDRKYFVDLLSGKKTEFKSTRGMDAAIVTPDKKYFVFSGRGGFSFVDRNTGSEVFGHGDGYRVYFKSDQSMFYTFSTNWDDDLTYSVHHALMFSYPQFKELERIDTRWSGFANPESLNFDPDKGVFMNAWGGRDIKTREVKVSFSVEQAVTEDDLKAEVAQRNRNAKIGNEAIERLSTMKTPPIVHAREDYVTPKIMSYSDNGKIVVYSNYGSGGSVVVWSFPEGMPSVAFRDETSTARGMSMSAILVPGEIRNGVISPAGKVIALETTEGVLFYESETQKSAFPKRELLGLLDNAALLGEQVKYGENTYKDVIMVDPSTGKTLGKVKTKGMGKFSANVRMKPGAFTFTGQNDVGILDPASPTEIKITPLSELPENDPARYQFERWTIKDKVTGKEAQLPGIRPLTSVDDRHIQSNFLIAYYFNEGFYIYDLKQKRTINEKAIYPGWMNDERVVFMPGINKLLVWTLVPVFTRPNATDQDPGASAFTIDIVTGEITPYLMSEPRSVFIEKGNAAKAAAFRYASLPCEEKKRDFLPGDNAGSATNGRLIVLGYDCDVKAYVVAKRNMMHPGSNSTVQESRLYAMTEEEMSAQGFINVTKSYRICPVCHGYPMSYSKQTTSGWSDWEQKSLNIYVYTREWETKTEEIGTTCRRCKGDAWVKVD